MVLTMKAICDDLNDETAALGAITRTLTEDQWKLPTPAEGWDTRETIIHLGMADVAASMAVLEPTNFLALREKMSRGESDLHEISDVDVHGLSGEKLWDWFAYERNRMTDAFRTLEPKARIPWFGPDMGALSFATARLMETWSHGHDVADTFGHEFPRSDRLRHVAHIGVTTRGWSYVNRGLEVPDVAVRVELNAPSGETWTWGPENSNEIVRADAYEFCLVVTQRRRASEATMDVEGEAAKEWMELAQAFAGPPTDANEGRVAKV